MGRFKPVRAKKAAAPQVKPGLPCLIIVIGGIFLVAVLLFVVMKYAS